MADFEVRFGDFRPDSAGISEIFTSGAMQAALREVAEPLAAKASGAARANLHHGGFKDEESEPYEAVVKVATHTAIGHVWPATEQGFTDQKLNHTLDGLNH